MSIETEFRRKIIVDVDPGTDDAWALFLLISGEVKYNLEILAITCVHGNTSLNYSARNTLMILETLDRNDIPVYLGVDEPIIQRNRPSKNFHGIDGFNELPNYGVTVDMNRVKQESAIDIIQKLIKECPHEITFVSLGPVTNLALCMKMYHHVRTGLKDIWLMGGNVTGVGNITNSAEFNFYVDPEAVDIIFKSARCPITVLPLETGRPDNFIIDLTWRYSAKLMSSTKYSKFLNFINSIEKHVHEVHNSQFWTPFDAIAVGAMLNPSIVSKSKKRFPSIELNGELTRGQLVFDQRKKDDNSSVLFIEKVDEELFKEMILFSVQ